jgi:SAM-dependent methyltransferase
MASDTWDDYAADWDADSDVQAYAEQAFESLRREVFPLLPNLQQARVLDFGCGTGLLTEKLSPYCATVVAVDSSTEMIRALERKVDDHQLGNVLPLVTEVTSTTIANRSGVLCDFSLAMASSVCSFLPNMDQTLRDIASTMKPGGLFVQWDWASEMPAEKIQGAYEEAEFRCLHIADEFEMATKNGSAPVIMAIGRKVDHS